MRLFQALLRKRMPHGHIFRGKDRLVKKVLPEHVQQLRDQLRIEEQNMFYLRHPYLTPEQSYGHSVALGKPQERMLRLKMIKKEFRNDVTLESMLGHLRHTEAWD